MCNKIMDKIIQRYNKLNESDKSDIVWDLIILIVSVVLMWWLYVSQ